MPKLPITTLEHAFMSMCYVARAEGLEIEEQCEQMLDAIIALNDHHDPTSMIDNMENVYKQLMKDKNLREEFFSRSS